MKPLTIQVGPDTTDHLNKTIQGGQLIAVNLLVYVEYNDQQSYGVEKAVEGYVNSLIYTSNLYVHRCMGRTMLDLIRFYPIRYEATDIEKLGFPFFEVKKPQV